MIEQDCPIWGTKAKVTDGELVSIFSENAGGNFIL